MVNLMTICSMNYDAYSQEKPDIKDILNPLYSLVLWCLLCMLS